MSLRSINLNLVPVLQALLREANLSRAGRELGLTQPAVSAALARLRAALNDPRLVPVGRGMALTPRARELIGPVDEACAALDRVLVRSDFDPAAARRTFVMATLDYSAVVVAPPMMPALARQAPGVSMRFVTRQATAALAALRTGEVDLMFLPEAVLKAMARSDLRHRNLFRDQIVYAAGPTSPLYGATDTTPEMLASQAQVRFLPPELPGMDGVTEATRAEFGRLSPPGEAQAGVTWIEQFSVLPLIAALSGNLTLAPRRLVMALQAHMPLRIFDVGSEAIEQCMVWSVLQDADPGHRWFRDLLHATVGDDRPP